MAREVKAVDKRTVKAHKFALEREQVTVVCDDGAGYIFERPTDGRQVWRLARRLQPDGELSTSNGVLPGAVKETATSVFGDNWSKD